MTKRQLEEIIRREVRRRLHEEDETWQDAADKAGLKGQLDNEFMEYMMDLFGAVKNIESYPIVRTFPENKNDINKVNQAFKLLKSTAFGKVFYD